ncbi:MAG TPA: DUF5719 family protein [Actinomycetota bacterium]|nr:DUF5719 family protein [Actinomycetota bacterium]
MKRSEVAFLVAAAIATGSIVAARNMTASTTEANVADAGRFLSAGWYCPSPAQDGIDAFMGTANLGADPVHLQRRAIGGGAVSVGKGADLAATRRDVVDIADFGVSSPTGLTEAFGAATTSDELAVGKGVGVALSRCSLQPWDTWYFPTASTAKGSGSNSLLLANPFDEEAVFSARIMTAGGPQSPALLRNIVVPRLTQLRVNLDEAVRETPTFGVEVRVTMGRVIAANMVRFTTRDLHHGLSLDVGVRTPSPSWYLAGGIIPPTGEEFLDLVNPGDREALVAVVFQLSDQQIAPDALQELAVAAGSKVRVRLRDFIPVGSYHGIAVTTLNETRIVAGSQIIDDAPGGGGAENVSGAPEPSERWVVPVGSHLGGDEIAISVANPATTSTKISITLIDAQGIRTPQELKSIRVDGGRVVLIDLRPYVQGSATAIVRALADGKVAVQSLLRLGPPYQDFASSSGQIFD